MKGSTSYSTVVLYIRDHGDLDFPSQKNSPKNQLHNSILAPWQYWLGITKSKSAFSTILNASNEVLQSLRNILFNGIFYCLPCLPLPACLPACPACLPLPSGKCNSITAKVMGLNFSLFDIASSRDVPFGIPQYVQCMHHGLTFILLCVPFLFADSQKCRFVVARCMTSLQYVCK